MTQITCMACEEAYYFGNIHQCKHSPLYNINLPFQENVEKIVTYENVKDIMTKTFEECTQLREAGQREYAHDTNNALANFERVGKSIQLPREKILWVYLEKHLDGIKAYINGHRSQRESIDGRIKDAIVYLVLLRSMCDDSRIHDIFSTIKQGNYQNEKNENIK